MFSTKTTSLTDGFTLIELLLACSLSGFLVILMLTHYSVLYRVYLSIEDYSDLISKGRFSLYLINAKLAHNHGLYNPALENKSKGFGVISLDDRRTFFYLGQNKFHQGTLFLKDGNQPSESIATDVIDMSVRYGVKNQELSAHQVIDWSSVESVQIILFFKTKYHGVKEWRTYVAIKKN